MSAVKVAQDVKQAEKAVRQDELLLGGRKVFRLPPDHDHSGDAHVPLGTFPPGTVVDRAELAVSGEAFRGAVKDLAGAEATESPATYAKSGLPATEGGQQGFIVDLGGLRTILQVRYDDDSITLVLPWMGTQFGTAPLYPGPFDEKATGLPTSSTSTVDLPGIETQKLFVQVASSSTTPAQFAARCRVTTGTLPIGVRAFVNDRLPFWTSPAPLSDEVAVTGLVDELNALLAGATEDVTAELVVSADTPGVIEADWQAGRDLSFATRALARWGGSEQLDVEVRSLEPATVGLVWPVGAGAAHWLVSKLELDLDGDFPPWRARSLQASDAPGRLALTISGRFAVARRVDVTEPTTLHGLSVLLRAASDAEFVLELQRGDAPDLAAPPLASADVVVSLGDGPAWVEALFASPVEVSPGTCWMVAKARKGSVEWCATSSPAGADPLSFFSDAGSRFEAYPAIGAEVAVAQARLLRAPFASENEPLVDVRWRAGAETLSGNWAPDHGAAVVSLSPSHPLDVAPGPEAIALDVEVTSRATGTLSMTTAGAFYREKT